ncbi:MAG: DUF3872 domain-containing protein [Tannerellaceae bacterium]|jgi:hypothetical protein|nr:DUF3872 domain-containing protein [Tannerellaceae bacterium]
MKKYFSYILFTLLLGAIACACSDNLSIRQSYTYSIGMLPLPSALENGEAVNLEFSIVREGYYEGTAYKFRYFQSAGKGVLTDSKGKSIPVNRFQDIPSDDFTLIYQCTGEEQQQLDFVFMDNFGQVVEYTIAFNSKRTEPEPEEKPVNYNFEFTTLPVPAQILLNDTIEIQCSLIKADVRNDATYSVRYFQPTGRGTLLLENEISLQPNKLYNLDSETFRLYYVSNSEERQSVDVYIVDSKGQTVRKTFDFDNIPIVQEPEIDFSFTLEVLPIPKSIATNETIEIRCRIKKADERNNSRYYIRYFQPDGKGELRMDNGTLFFPNDLYSLNRNSFRLYYTSHCAEQQTIDVYIEDQNGQVVQKTFGLQNEKAGDDATADVTLSGE